MPSNLHFATSSADVLYQTKMIKRVYCTQYFNPTEKSVSHLNPKSGQKQKNKNFHMWAILMSSTEFYKNASSDEL